MLWPQQSRRYPEYLKAPKDRQRVAVFFNIDESLLVTAVHQFSIIRNICAHHSRLWDRELAVPLKLPKNHPAFAQAKFSASHRIHNSLVFLAHFINQIDPGNTELIRSVKQLLKKCPQTLNAMGFEPDWESCWPWCIIK
jgi:abortive infection bacteriophage resistance protein